MFPTRCRFSICQPDGRLDSRSGWVERIVGGLPVLERLRTEWREWAGVAGDGLDSRRRVRLHRIKHDCLFRCIHNSISIYSYTLGASNTFDRESPGIGISPVPLQLTGSGCYCFSCLLLHSTGVGLRHCHY